MLDQVDMTEMSDIINKSDEIRSSVPCFHIYRWKMSEWVNCKRSSALV